MAVEVTTTRRTVVGLCEGCTSWLKIKLGLGLGSDESWLNRFGGGMVSEFGLSDVWGGRLFRGRLLASGVDRGRLQEVLIARRDDCYQWGFLAGSLPVVGFDHGGAPQSCGRCNSFRVVAIYRWLLGVSIEGVGGYGGVIVSGEVFGD